ncbi:hypothetical protein EDM76_11640 [bacterium]|nr:MAG: hypothetical protein EDM76_11640 [bacterium]MCL4231728.1 hypothetical protein [Dehalococcoidia bacterium]
MTSTRKRPRRDRAEAPPAPASQGVAPVQAGRALKPPPEWRWRTFPVYFAFSLALFVGVYVGLLAAAANDAGNGSISLLLAGIPAVMLGLGLSRIVVRFMMTRGVIRPRAKRK